ncbi:probable DNA-directed RNA polymerases I and III subunit RPAC2 [Formica exsecta]|uniref:probable DNA-directed RNA polymerases I and III subunit RPAC2 n=1 Tax=Formica exsecta TaxID=72781 RepID=UPI001142E341|nr:probable DNA-directed RNA polymerases I and III subunit RPAC2 [Formica exsecta]
MNYTMEKRLSKIPGNHGITYATFVLVDEGHTLGNALSSVINEYPGIKICAYTVPHPAENKIHFNIQTTGENAIEVLKRGLQDLEKICDHTIETFDKAYKKYKSSNDVPTEHITT